jgi:hypothetical protein
VFLEQFIKYGSQLPFDLKKAKHYYFCKQKTELRASDIRKKRILVDRLQSWVQRFQPA